MATTQTHASFTWATGGPTTSGTTNPIVLNAGGSAGPYAATVWPSIVVVGSPTVWASVQVQESPDGGTTWYSPPAKVFTAGLTAGTYTSGGIPLDPTTTAVQIVQSAQTGGTSSTTTIQLGQITGI